MKNILFAGLACTWWNFNSSSPKDICVCFLLLGPLKVSFLCVHCISDIPPYFCTRPIHVHEWRTRRDFTHNVILLISEKYPKDELEGEMEKNPDKKEKVQPNSKEKKKF